MRPGSRAKVSVSLVPLQNRHPEAPPLRDCEFIDIWRFFDRPKLFVFSIDFSMEPIKLQTLRMTILWEN